MSSIDSKDSKDSFKAQLDRAATGLDENGNPPSVAGTVVNKVSETIPAVASTVRSWVGMAPDGANDASKDSPNSDTSAEAATKSAPSIERPLHDAQIEDFLREQHRNKDLGKLLKAARG